MVLLGFVIAWKKTRFGNVMVVVGVLATYFFAIPLTANLLSLYSQSYEPLWAEDLARSQAGAIVVLAGGRYWEAPEYGQDTVSFLTLGRVRYAARLARVAGLPVIASGGIVDADKEKGVRVSEAELIARVMKEDYGLGGVITEDNSRTTRENAINTAALLRDLGIDSIVLVTHAVHMARAVTAFQRFDIRVTPAPTLYFPSRLEPLDIESWLPSALSMYQTRYALHELLGRVWYWWLDAGPDLI